jgi:hypothetical protein
LILSGCFAFVSLAHASNYNPNVLPVGEREPFLANTGAALRGSAGAVFYNPAGLAELKKSRISLSGSTYVYNEFSTDKFTTWDDTDLPLKAYGFNTLPSTLVSVFSSGEWVYAVSILVPAEFRFKNRQAWATPNTNTTLVLTSDTQEIWAGFSVARRIAENWELGFSLFGTSAISAVVVDTNVKFPAAPSSMTNVLQTSNSSVYSALASVGLLYRASDTWDLGIKVQAPSVRLWGKADRYASNTLILGGAVSTSSTDQNQVDANYVYPADTTLGVAFRPAARLRILFDLSLQWSAFYETFPGSLGSQTIDLASTLRYNLGSEINLGKATLLGLGFFYNPSTKQVVNADLDQKEDFFGATCGLYYGDEVIRAGLGGYYSWSSGLRVAANSLEKAPSSSHVFALMLTSSFLY